MNPSPDVGQMRQTYRFGTTADENPNDTDDYGPLSILDGLPFTPLQVGGGLAAVVVLLLVLKKGGDDDGITIYQR